MEAERLFQGADVHAGHHFIGSEIILGASGMNVGVGQGEPTLPGTYCAFHHPSPTFSHTDCN
jgi:hypothetical protein